MISISDVSIKEFGIPEAPRSPEHSISLTSCTTLESPDHWGKFKTTLQLKQEVHMVRHHNPAQDFVTIHNQDPKRFHDNLCHSLPCQYARPVTSIEKSLCSLTPLLFNQLRRHSIRFQSAQLSLQYCTDMLRKRIRQANSYKLNDA
jgi:hypothetical protein